VLHNYIFSQSSLCIKTQTSFDIEFSIKRIMQKKKKEEEKGALVIAILIVNNYTWHRNESSACLPIFSTTLKCAAKFFEKRC
jgi:hypothetical protein